MSQCTLSVPKEYIAIIYKNLPYILVLNGTIFSENINYITYVIILRLFLVVLLKKLIAITSC